jgi:pimeloyl-ACP methyl ester carboxylesterase
MHDGAQLQYWVSRCPRRGAAPLVFLHGAASNHTRWSELLEMTALTENATTLRPDLRGNGASMWRGHLDLRAWTTDIREILEHERLPAAVLVGHSLGAQIALRFAADVRPLTRALVLIDPIFPHALRGGRRLMWKLKPAFVLLTRAIRVLNAIGLRRRSFQNRDLRILDVKTRRELAESGDPEHLARKYSSLSQILPYLPTANYLQELTAMVERLPPMESIDLPVLVILASGTSIADTDTVRQQIQRVPDSDVSTIQADHWPLTERPREVGLAIENWMATRKLTAATRSVPPANNEDRGRTEEESDSRYRFR